MKKVFLVVSFGISYYDICEKNIVVCECDLVVFCFDCDLFCVFIFGMIICKFCQCDGIDIDMLLQVL